MNGYFFFSSRRRHTRSDRDWSSDVCSSDLLLLLPVPPVRLRARVKMSFHLPVDRSVKQVQSYPQVLSKSRSEERRVGKSVDLGGRRIIKKKKKKSRKEAESKHKEKIE